MLICAGRAVFHACCTWSQSAISELTFPIFFTRSLSFWTAPCGGKRSFEAVSNSTRTRDSTENATTAYQYSRIFLPRQRLHIGCNYWRSEMAEMAVHNNRYYTCTRTREIVGAVRCGTNDIDVELPTHLGMRAGLLADHRTLEADPCKN